jgi:hypothetical protein
MIQVMTILGQRHAMTCHGLVILALARSHVVLQNLLWLGPVHAQSIADGLCSYFG